MALLEVTPTGAHTVMKRNAMAGIFTMLTGSPGTAKSAIARQFAKAWNLYFIDIRLAQSDPTDLNGFPKIYASEINGQEFAGYVPFETFPTTNTQIPEGFAGWFVFFDELNSGDRGVAKAAYKIILDRMVGAYRLHPNVVMAGAGNLDTDGALTEDQGSALQSRMCNVRMGIDREGFRTYAEEQNFDHRITSFLHFKPDMAYAFDPEKLGLEDNYPCYRTWEFTNELLKVIPDEEFGDHETLVALAGNLGEGCARDFMSFCALDAKLPKIEDIIKNPDSVKVPKETGQLYALVGALASHMQDPHTKPLVTFLERMPIEFQIVSLRQAIRRDRELLNDAAITDWIAKNGQELF